MSTQKIDDNLSGITTSSEVIAMGRPDIEDRPGEALVELVSEYRVAGGFRKDDLDEVESAASHAPLAEVNGLVGRYTTDTEAPENDLKD